MAKKCKENKSELFYTLTEIGLVAEDWTITEMVEQFRAFVDILEAVAKRNGEDCETIELGGKLPYSVAKLKHKTYYEDGEDHEEVINVIVSGAIQSRVKGEWSTTYHIDGTLLEFAKSGKTIKEYLIEKTEKDRERFGMLYGQEEADNAENNI